MWLLVHSSTTIRSFSVARQMLPILTAPATLQDCTERSSASALGAIATRLLPSVRAPSKASARFVWVLQRGLRRPIFGGRYRRTHFAWQGQVTGSAAAGIEAPNATKVANAS